MTLPPGKIKTGLACSQNGYLQMSACIRPNPVFETIYYLSVKPRYPTDGLLYMYFMKTGLGQEDRWMVAISIKVRPQALRKEVDTFC
jgi:hypothetical protein